MSVITDEMFHLYLNCTLSCLLSTASCALVVRSEKIEFRAIAKIICCLSQHIEPRRSSLRSSPVLAFANFPKLYDKLKASTNN